MHDSAGFAWPFFLANAMNDKFERLATWVADKAGQPAAFVLAFVVVVIWGTVGPFVGYSDTWQLVINTSTTIITFWMVFLVQATQNRDTKALQLKLDELIHAKSGARDEVAGAERRSGREMEALRQE